MSPERLSLLVVGVVFTLLGAFVIILRGYVWFVQKRRQGLDDIFMGLAWLFSVGFAVASFTSWYYGSGSSTVSVPLDHISKTIQSSFVVEALYGFCLVCVKMSIMTLYLRIAGTVHNWFWKGTVIMIVIQVAQFVAIIIAGGLQCRPLAKYWNPELPGSCFNLTTYFYATGIFTIISDVIILALPMPLFWALKRPRAERVAICAAFLFGFLSTLMSGVRLYSIKNYTLSDDPIRDAAPINMWSFIEINLGMLCASGPVIKAIVHKPAKPTSSAYYLGSTHTDKSTRWQPTRSYNVTTSVSGSTYAGSFSCVETGIKEQPKADQQVAPPIWDGRGPASPKPDSRTLQPYSEADFLSPWDNARSLNVQEWIADTRPTTPSGEEHIRFEKLEVHGSHV